MTIIITSDIDDSDRIVSDDSDNCQRPTSKDMQLKRTMVKAGKVHPPSHLLSPLDPPWWAPIMSGFLRPVAWSAVRSVDSYSKLKAIIPVQIGRAVVATLSEILPAMTCQRKWENDVRTNGKIVNEYRSGGLKNDDQNLSSFSRLIRQSNQRTVKLLQDI